MANKTGGSMGGFPEQSPARRKRMKKRAENQERRWAEKSSDVTVSYSCICPAEGCRAEVHHAASDD
jgi:hypothetical protein